MDMVMVHGHGTLRSLRKRACISSLLISSSDFFYKLVAAGQLSRHLGVRLSLSVSHRRSQFPLRPLCPCVAMAHLSRLTAHVARLTTHVLLLTAPSSRWLLLAQGGRGGHSVRARLRAVTLPGPWALFPSPASSHHHSRIPSFALSIAVCALPLVCLSQWCGQWWLYCIPSL
jgi:hypothetical protein